MSNAAIASRYLGDLHLPTPSFVETVRQLARSSWATVCRLLPGLRTDANAKLTALPACSMEDVALLEAAFRVEFEPAKRNADVTDELLRVSLIGIGKMD
jgi:hypothetical protein